MSNDRVVGYDIARALAVFGMVIVNFKTVMHPNSHSEDGWLALFNILDGRASAIFVILAGVGISLLTNTARQSGHVTNLKLHQQRLHRRAVFLFVTGLLFVEIWPADILHYYAIYIAIAVLMIRASSQTLLITALLISFTFPLLFAVFDYSHSWNWETLVYADFWSPIGFIRNLFFNGFHPVLPWLAFLLLGMVLGRMPMEDARTRRTVFWSGLLMTTLIEAAALAIRFFAINNGYPDETAKYLFSTNPMPPLPLYFLSAVGSSLMIISLCIQVGKSWGNKLWLRPLIFTGRMALTLYVAHIVVGMGVLEEFGLLNKQSISFAVGGAVLFFLISIVFASIWMPRFKLGPLEWLMRKATTSV